VRICTDPLLGGVVQALRWERIEEILDRYRGMVDLFLLRVDRDGEQAREQTLRWLEQQSMSALGTRQILLAANAWQEIEVWALAGLQRPRGWTWGSIRAERDPKERYFRPYAEARGLIDEPGAGRRTLAHEAAGNYSRIRQLCPEDVADLEGRVQRWIQERSH
jgi:hypothetical protein